MPLSLTVEHGQLLCHPPAVMQHSAMCGDDPRALGCQWHVRHKRAWVIEVDKTLLQLTQQCWLIAAHKLVTMLLHLCSNGSSNNVAAAAAAQSRSTASTVPATAVAVVATTTQVAQQHQQQCNVAASAAQRGSTTNNMCESRSHHQTKPVLLLLYHGIPVGQCCSSCLVQLLVTIKPLQQAARNAFRHTAWRKSGGVSALLGDS